MCYVSVDNVYSEDSKWEAKKEASMDDWTLCCHISFESARRPF